MTSGDIGRRPANIAELAGLYSRPAIAVIGVWMLVNCTIVTDTLGARYNGWWVLAEVAYFAVVPAMLLRWRGDPLAPVPTIVGAVTTPAAIAAEFFNLRVPVADLIVVAPVGGAAVLVCSIMAMRGRQLVAWLTLGACLVALAWWGWSTGQGILGGLGYSSPLVPLLLTVSCLAAVLRPAIRAIHVLHDQAATSAAVRADAWVRSQERQRQADRLEELARPILVKVALGGSLDDADIERARLVEARLRDSIRAADLDDPALAGAVWQARGRGVTVLMFDDGGFRAVGSSDPNPVSEERYSSITAGEEREDIRQALVAACVRHIEAAARGSVTIRVHPPGRDVLLSVVVDDGGQVRRVEYGLTGELRD